MGGWRRHCSPLLAESSTQVSRIPRRARHRDGMDAQEMHFMRPAILFVGIAFGCSADPGGVEDFNAEPPGFALPGSTTAPDCASLPSWTVDHLEAPVSTASMAVSEDGTVHVGFAEQVHDRP